MIAVEDVSKDTVKYVGVELEELPNGDVQVAIMVGTSRDQVVAANQVMINEYKTLPEAVETTINLLKFLVTGTSEET